MMFPKNYQIFFFLYNITYMVSTGNSVGGGRCRKTCLIASYLADLLATVVTIQYSYAAISIYSQLPTRNYL